MNASATPVVPSGGSSRIPVAIVDDDVGVRLSLRLMLRRSDLFDCVAEFDSGDAALAHLPQQSVAVVMMDLKMPGTDGVTCIRRLRERGHSGKVVVLSGYFDGQSMQEAARAGADGFLTKPVKPGDLVAALEYCWSGGIPLAADLRSYLERPHPPAAPAKVADPMLTELENRILGELETGDTYAQIADRLKLSEPVLKKAVHTAYGKLGTNNKVSALKRWHQHRREQIPE